MPELSAAGKMAAFGIAMTAVVLLVSSGFDIQLGLPTALAGLFVLVESLEKTSVMRELSALLPQMVQQSATVAAWASGVALAVGCNLVNDLPAGLVAGRVVELAHLPDHIRSAVLIGVDLGPNLSVTGPLATILWLTALRREGQSVSAWAFLKLGVLVMPPAGGAGAIPQRLLDHTAALEPNGGRWVTTAGGLLGLAAQTPAGAMIDATRRKRGAVVLALAVLAIGALVIFAVPTFWPVIVANTTIAVVGNVFGPAVAAVTFGLYARNRLARRMGRNSAFDHAGTWRSRRRVASAICSRSGPCFCSCRCSLSRPRLPCFPFPAALSTKTAPADWGPVVGKRKKIPSGRPATPCCFSAVRSWCSRSARCCSTSPTRRCYRLSARSWRRLTRYGRPR